MLLLLKFSSSFYSISLIVHFHHLVFFSTLLSLVFKYINSSHYAISHIPNPQGFCDNWNVVIYGIQREKLFLLSDIISGMSLQE